MAFLGHGAKSFGMKVEHRCQLLLRPIRCEHLPLHIHFPFGEFQDYLVIPVVAKLLEDVLAIFGPPVAGELHDPQVVGTTCVRS